MHGRRTEHHKYTEAQVREHLATALAIIREAEIDPLEHEALLVNVFNSLAAKEIILEAVVPGVPNLAVPRGL